MPEKPPPNPNYVKVTGKMSLFQLAGLAESFSPTTEEELHTARADMIRSHVSLTCGSHLVTDQESYRRLGILMPPKFYPHAFYQTLFTLQQFWKCLGRAEMLVISSPYRVMRDRLSKVVTSVKNAQKEYGYANISLSGPLKDKLPQRRHLWAYRLMAMTLKVPDSLIKELCVVGRPLNDHLFPGEEADARNAYAFNIDSSGQQMPPVMPHDLPGTAIDASFKRDVRHGTLKDVEDLRMLLQSVSQRHQSLRPGEINPPLSALPAPCEQNSNAGHDSNHPGRVDRVSLVNLVGNTNTDISANGSNGGSPISQISPATRNNVSDNVSGTGSQSQENATVERPTPVLPNLAVTHEDADIDDHLALHPVVVDRGNNQNGTRHASVRGIDFDQTSDGADVIDLSKESYIGLQAATFLQQARSSIDESLVDSQLMGPVDCASNQNIVHSQPPPHTPQNRLVTIHSDVVVTSTEGPAPSQLTAVPHIPPTNSTSAPASQLINSGLLVQSVHPVPNAQTQPFVLSPAADMSLQSILHSPDISHYQAPGDVHTRTEQLAVEAPHSHAPPPALTAETVGLVVRQELNSAIQRVLAQLTGPLRPVEQTTVENMPIKEDASNEKNNASGTDADMNQDITSTTVSRKRTVTRSDTSSIGSDDSSSDGEYRVRRKKKRASRRLVKQSRKSKNKKYKTHRHKRAKHRRY